MPLRDLRALVIAKGTKWPTSGHLWCRYRNAVGKTYRAKVLGAGTSSGLKLDVNLGNTNTVVDNVPKATTSKTNSAYVSRARF